MKFLAFAGEELTASVLLLVVIVSVNQCDLYILYIVIKNFMVIKTLQSKVNIL